MVVGPSIKYTFSNVGEFAKTEIALPYYEGETESAVTAFAEESLFAILKGVPYLFGGKNAGWQVSV